MWPRMRLRFKKWLAQLRGQSWASVGAWCLLGGWLVVLYLLVFWPRAYQPWLLSAHVWLLCHLARGWNWLIGLVCAVLAECGQLGRFISVSILD